MSIRSLLWKVERFNTERDAKVAAANALHSLPCDGQRVAGKLCTAAQLAEQWLHKQGTGQTKAIACIAFVLNTEDQPDVSFDDLRPALDALVDVFNERGWPNAQ